MTTVGTLYSSAARTTALDSIGGNSFDSTIPGLLQQAIVAVGNNGGGGGGGSTAWGAITGTLSNQTDLQAALDAKVTAAGGSIANTVDLNASMFTALNTKVALTGDAMTGALNVTLSSLGTTPANAVSLSNSTAAALGAQQVSPSFSFIGNGWNNSSNASHPIEFAWHALPAQGNPITGSLFLRSRVNNGSWGNCARFYNQQDAAGSVMSLTSAYGTVDFTIGGTGTLRTNISSTGVGSFQIDSGGGSPVILSTRASAWLGLGAAAASPIEQTFAGCDGSGTNITGGILNISAGRGTGTGISGVLNFRSHAAAASGSTVNATPVNVLSIIRPGVIRITGIPTSSAGLSAGDVYSNAGILTIV